MPHAYTEDQLVEQPAKAGRPPSPWPSPSGRGNDGVFAELGWTTVSAWEETFGAPSPGLAATLSRPTGEGQVSEGASLGRETKGEVVLVCRLHAALERLNPALPHGPPSAAARGHHRVSFTVGYGFTAR
jgi:type I restriction enzyme R subunit